MTTALRVLGSLELHGPDGLIGVRQGRERKLLALLLVNQGAAVPVDVIIEELWPEQRPANERNALQVLVSGLRRQLEPVSDDLALDRSADAYRLTVRDPSVVDAFAFERDVRAADDEVGGEPSQERTERALELLDGALAMWRGHPYTDAMYDAFAQAEIARLRELHANAREQRARLLLRLGRSAEAVEALQALATEYPLRESVWAALILALYRSRRQGEALRLYTVARRHLVDELGVEPGAELKHLEQRVLAQDPSLDWIPFESREHRGAEPPSPPAERAASSLRLETSVPAELSTLVGRDAEIDAVCALLADNRLVTLTGTGGIGKTRVALAAASRLRDDVVTRVIDLGSVVDGPDLALVVASDLGVQTQPGVDPVDSIASALGASALVLVLDTCEHVLNSAAILASRLLRRSAGLRILATSRQPLGVAGEVVWTTPTLEPHDAVRLFAERARARRQEFQLDATNAQDVTEICRTLDGLPLAIELAAARVNVLSPAGILQRIGDRFTLLSRGAAGADERQRSLRATVEWSHDLLTADQRAFFARLSVFPASFDLDAAVAVAGGGLDEDPLDLLGALVERSLVQSVDGGRFVLLDTLRSFAAEQLVDASVVRDRHASWYFDLALAADPWSHGPLPEGWWRLRADGVNCVAALDWLGGSGRHDLAARLAGALAGFWMLDGQLLRAHHELDARRTVEVDDLAAAPLWRGIGVLELYRNRFEASVAAATRSVDAAKRTREPMLVASTLLTLGSAQWGTGDLVASQQSLADAVAIFEREGDGRGHGFALARLGRTYDALGDARAVGTVVEGSRLLQRTGDLWMRCVALEHLAGCLLSTDALTPALVAAQQAVDEGRQAGSRAGVLFALGTLARVLLAAGQPDEAVLVVISGLEMSIDMVNPGGTADCVDLGASIARARGDLALAARLVGCADAIRAAQQVEVPAVASAARARFVEALAERSPAAFADARRAGAATPVTEALERIRALAVTGA